MMFRIGQHYRGKQNSSRKQKCMSDPYICKIFQIHRFLSFASRRHISIGHLHLVELPAATMQTRRDPPCVPRSGRLDSIPTGWYVVKEWVTAPTKAARNPLLRRQNGQNNRTTDSCDKSREAH